MRLTTKTFHYIFRIIRKSLVPPSLTSGTEIILGPSREQDLAVFGDVTVSKGKWKRSGSTNNGTIRSVLRSVAWAHEFVLSSRPWHDTTQVSTDYTK
jgi:hypothetical protein